MRFLVAHDGSEQADKALGRAGELAAKIGAELTVVSVTPDLCLSVDELSPAECGMVAKTLTQETEGIMKKIAAGLEAKNIKAQTLVRSGRPVDEILAAAEETGADLIVLGSRGRHGARRFFLGSVSGEVCDHAKCDVLIIK